MQESPGFEDYPAGTVVLANLLSVAICLTGAFLVYQFGILPALLYLLYCIALELRLMAGHCVDCYYYGRTCAFGKGRISALFFPRGVPERFCGGPMTWTDMVPDMLVLIIPVVAGIAAVFLEFRWPVLLLVVILLILGSSGNAFVRGKLACRYCRQREIGCPACRLFARNNP